METNPAADPRLRNKTPHELMKDQEGYKRCLWSYWVEVKKGGLMSQGDFDKVWKMFNLCEVDATERYKVFEKTVSKVDKLEQKLRDSGDLQTLKFNWGRIIELDLTEDENKFLIKVKDECKNDLTSKAKTR